MFRGPVYGIRRGCVRIAMGSFMFLVRVCQGFRAADVVVPGRRKLSSGGRIVSKCGTSGSEH